MDGENTNMFPFEPRTSIYELVSMKGQGCITDPFGATLTDCSAWFAPEGGYMNLGLLCVVCNSGQVLWMFVKSDVHRGLYLHFIINFMYLKRRGSSGLEKLVDCVQSRFQLIPSLGEPIFWTPCLWCLLMYDVMNVRYLRFFFWQTVLDNICWLSEVQCFNLLVM